MRLLFCFLLSVLTGCNNDNHQDLISIKKDFIKTICDGNIDEGPFQMKYSLRTILFSKEVISLFGKVDVYTHLPHSWGYYEGKTYCKINNKYKEISLNDIFTTSEQKEFLRSYCENDLKQQWSTYFYGEGSLRTQLEIDDINTFVIDDQFLILIFQPYCAGNYVDGPVVVKIPYEKLKGHWNSKNPLITLLPIRSFISSWDKENISSGYQEEVSIKR